jgi:glucosamine--fructose-6-phosphate aminotransferase (isomerizing)
LPLDIDVIQGRYFIDLMAQPEALEATWNGLRTATSLEKIAGVCARDRFQRVVLTGMGASYFGLHPLCIDLAAHGWTPVMLETSELIYSYRHLLTPATLVVAVSQSGASVETVRLLEMNANRATIIGVTNSAESPLARGAQVAVLTAAGEESSVSCKTYVAAQMAHSMLSAVLCGADPAERLNELQGAPSLVQGYLARWRTHVAEFAELLQDVRDIFLVGRGRSLAAACTGALTTKESTHVHGEGMSSAAFRHGPFEMLQAGIFVGVFGGAAETRSLNEGLLTDLAATPAKSAMIATDAAQPAYRLPEATRAAAPIVEILPVQMMTLALAALGGREAGKFERATKITVVE